jgi:hypothetical protein
MVHKVYVKVALTHMMFMIPKLKIVLHVILNTVFNVIKQILHSVYNAKQILLYTMEHVSNFQITATRVLFGQIIKL